MSSVLLAVFNTYESAHRARLRLVLDGFPTDRVELTASQDLGRAGLEPGNTPHTQLAKYFATVCSGDLECAERLASALDSGAATVTVHPRGNVEVESANAILEQAGAMEFIRHDLERQTFERAATKQRRAWIQNFWFDLPHETSGEYHCIYCRLFERRPASSM